MKIFSYILLLFISISVRAQQDIDDAGGQDLTLAEKKANNVRLYNQLIDEAIKVHTGNDFLLHREQRIPMKDKVGNIVNIPLEAGNWYHFVFIGDPSCKKLKVSLFKEGIGDFVTDRTGRRKGEFYSEFSFICRISGMYEFTCMQKGDMPNPLAYLMLFRKNPAMAKNE